MRIVFMGSGEIALPSLEWLLASCHELVGVVTQPDRPAGRHQELRGPRTKELALAAGVPVLQPERVRRPAALAEIEALAADLVVVMAYGQILPKELLEMPRVACVNVHASLLPKYRGAACVQAPIAAGETESGLTIIHMAEGLDTGDVILQRTIGLAEDETGGRLHDRLAELAPEVLGEAIGLLESGTAPRWPQDEAAASYAPKLTRADGILDWSRPAGELERLVRAYDPWPGTSTTYRDRRGRDRRLKVFPPAGVGEDDSGVVPGTVLHTTCAGIWVRCGDGALCLRVLQPDGGRRVPAEAFLAGHQLGPGDRFF